MRGRGVSPARQAGAIAAALLLAAAAPGCAQDAGPASPDAAREALQTGAYEDAARQYRTLALAGRSLPESARGWARALAATGEREAALEALREAAARVPEPVELERSQATLLFELGRVEEAEIRLRAAIEGGASDSALARLELARLLWSTGRREPARDLFDGLIDFYNASRSPSAEELMAVGAAVRYLGRHDPQLFHDAVRAYEEAIDADPGDPRPRVALAGLFLDKYNSQDAGQLLAEALERNPRHAPALLAGARRARFEGSGDALDLARRALEVDPGLTSARTLLARLYLELEDTERAEEEARRALRVDPASAGAWTELAAVAYLRGDSAAFEAARARVFERDPLHAELYEALAEVAYRTHRYADAVAFARQAVELDPLAWSAHAALGLNQLRVGELEAGRATLERAFAGDPFNVWVKNTLDLLDELEAFEVVRSERFVFRIHPDEAAVLSVYAPLLAEEAFAALAERYGARPPTPIAVEMYDRHADFSVRTVGLAGIGALGVSFGSVLAMDSPGARAGGSFNWGSTLWHEISHAFTLGHTGHRVPRWLSEGLAVLDERRARTGWGSDVTPDFLAAFREDRLPSLERFNYGFVRPAYPAQVRHSYFLASLLCELIEREEGTDALRRLLAAYRDGLGTAAAFERALGSDLESWDRRLRDHIEERYASALAALGSSPEGEAAPGGPFAAAMRGAARAHAEGRLEQAISELERARELFPEYAGPDAPGLSLARIHAEREEWDAAAAAYRAYLDRNEDHYEARLELADVERRRGNAAGEREVLAEAVWIDPFSPDLHERLASSYEEGGLWADAVRERRAVLALEPTDRALAYYRLARALHGAGQPAEARRTVLRALEIAPNYADALELLLELRGGS